MIKAANLSFPSQTPIVIIFSAQRSLLLRQHVSEIFSFLLDFFANLSKGKHQFTFNNLAIENCLENGE
jgi:hypothetical protein